MKNLFFILLMCLSVSVCTAQEDLKFSAGTSKYDGKPQQFAHLTARFSVKQNFLDAVLSSKLNEQVTISVTEGLEFSGKVIAKTVDGSGLETVVIESRQFKGLLLSVSKFTKQDGSKDFMGVITSRQYSDMLLMEKDLITGNYYWTRKQTSQMIAD